MASEDEYIGVFDNFILTDEDFTLSKLYDPPRNKSWPFVKMSIDDLSPLTNFSLIVSYFIFGGSVYSVYWQKINKRIGFDNYANKN